MTAARRAIDYLAIPAEYGGTLGGLVWSASGDALERWNGTTFAFADEIREVLAGAFARPPVPPFAFVLAILRKLRDEPASDSVQGRRLREAYSAGKGEVQLLRHAGLLIAELCRTMPSAANPPATEDVAMAVGQSVLADKWVLSETPPLLPEEFDRQFERRLADYDDSRLRHWLKFGYDPLGDAERLAEPLDSLPVRVEKLLAQAHREPRLAGAASLMPALDGALALPARRRSPDAVPQGGYCDVTTRGEPERLLPGQFALDRDEFIRRFAESELLYFQREEPHATRRPERLIVLDQGVRTWGGVRLALAAAALVFMRKESKRVGRVRFTTTSLARPVDVQVATVDALVRLLESSDLTTDPAASLHSALAPSDTPDPRDVIVLTHPRALRESGVQSALAAGAATDRIFALTVNDDGAAELVHWKETGPEVVRRFRTDLTTALTVGVPAEQRLAAPFEMRSWSGDVEPVPFPFRPGLVAPVVRMAFDAEGSWLVAASHNGMLQALAVDSPPAEVLPRSFRDGMVLQNVEAVLGVPGGVAVCGRMPAPPSLAVTIQSHGQPSAASSASESAALDRRVVAHYSRASRTVRLHEIGPCVDAGIWAAHPELNCVTLVLPNGHIASVDLGTHEIHVGPDAFNAAPTRIDLARKRARSGRGHPPYELSVNDLATRTGPSAPFLRLVANGMLVVVGGVSSRLMPMRDGKFLLEGALITRAVLASGTLALAAKRRSERIFVTIDCRENRILSETNLASVQNAIALSGDGRTIAYIRTGGGRSLAIASASNLGSPLVEVRPAALHNKVQVWLGERDAIQIGIGQYVHTFEADAGVLKHAVRRGVSPGERPGLQPQLPSESKIYDWSRFPWQESAFGHGFRAIVDRFGQVLVYRRSGELAASFLVRRDRAAAWIPSGVFWGDPVLIGGPTTPGAAELIGAELTRMGTR